MDFQSPESVDLTQAILARTSGSACARLHAEACAFVDGALSSERAALIQAHVAHCPDCTALLETMKKSISVLPEFSEVDPGPWFSHGVRVRIRALEQNQKEPSIWRFLRRPRACLELAYAGTLAGTLAGALVFQVPHLERPFQAVQTQTAPSLLEMQTQTHHSMQHLDQGLAHARAFGARSLHVIHRGRARLHHALLRTSQTLHLSSNNTEPSQADIRSASQD